MKKSSFPPGTGDESLPPFRRFQWVIPKELARSSAPHYLNCDLDQSMGLSDIEWLAGRGIKQVISVNEIKLAPFTIDVLAQRYNIAYFHSPITDFGAPTIRQLRDIHQASQRFYPSLVYCGYGHGRTGTVISALQILRGRRFHSRAEFERNHVGTRGQLDVLRDLHKEVFGDYPYEEK
ncbi:hypothetical protein F4679DRAFT_557783 [Xylaria curta]|nr:hypothetical protein F4679DRAFT_557783 [Xylaria curta]